MSEAEAEAAAAEIVGGVARPLSRDEVAAVCDIDRECNGDRAFCFLWWRGVVAESVGSRRQAAFNFIAANTGGGQRRIAAAAAWERISSTQWQLRSLSVTKDYRGCGFGRQLANGTPLDDTAYEVVADVAERDLAAQKFFRAIGWHGLPLTRLDGNGLIRFRADFAAAEPPPPPAAAAKPKRKRKPKPPPQTQGAEK